jgi:hypothetical protein
LASGASGVLVAAGCSSGTARRGCEPPCLSHRRAPDGGTRLEPVPLCQRIRGLFGVDDLDGTTRAWVTGSRGAILRRDLPDGG